MKLQKLFVLAILLVALLWPTAAFAHEPHDDRVVFGGTLTLESGQSQDGSLVIFGGAVTTEPDSTVNGDLVLIGGSVQIGGIVQGNIVGIGGAVRLGSQAVVNGDVFTLGATLRRDDGARVTGQIINGIDTTITAPVPGEDQGDFESPVEPQASKVSVNTNPLLKMIWFFFRIFLFAALAVLLVMFLPEPVNRVARAATKQPVITGGAGLLTAVLAPIALVAITITLILIPVTFIVALLLVAAWLLGWVALGLETGRRIAKALNLQWAPAISAGLGTLILSFVLGGFREMLPCPGLIPQVLVGLWGLGAVLLTRFGTQDYLPDEKSEVAPPKKDEHLESASPEALPEAFPEAEKED